MAAVQKNIKKEPSQGGVVLMISRDMKKIFFVLIALTLVFCACNKEQTTNIEKRNPLVFKAVIEGSPESKVTLDGRIPKWEVGDSIRINNNYIYKAQEAGYTSTFVAAGEEAGDAPYKALFPAAYSVQWGTPTMFFPPDDACPWVEGRFRMPM